MFDGLLLALGRMAHGLQPGGGLQAPAAGIQPETAGLPALPDELRPRVLPGGRRGRLADDALKDAEPLRGVGAAEGDVAEGGIFDRADLLFP